VSLLPELLRRLARAAHDRNGDIVDTTLDRLGKWSGWQPAVTEFMSRMEPRLQQYIVERIAATAEAAVENYQGSVLMARHGDSGSSNPMAGVTQDATSFKYTPSSSAEWTTTLTAAGIATGNPSALWLMQEAAGNLADSIGAFTLTASALAYQQTVTGWTRKAISMADGGGAGALNNAGTIGDVGVNSGLLLLYVAVTATPAATRDVCGMGGSTTFRGAQVTTGPAYKATPNDGSATATGAANPSTTVRPVLVRINRTAGVWSVTTNQEIVTPSPYTAPPNVAAAVFLGSALTTTPAMQIAYGACFRGAAAELSDAQVRTLLQGLGWTVSW
jgi:hypothetical protein